jgi:hypothetical protein
VVASDGVACRVAPPVEEGIFRTIPERDSAPGSLRGPGALSCSRQDQPATTPRIGVTVATARGL